MRLNHNIIHTLAGLAALLVVTFGATSLRAQKFGVKTNVISDATLNVNLGAEAVVAPKWSVDVTGDLNLWTLSDGKKWKHWYVQPEARYWLCQATAGHFFGLHVFGGQSNMAKLDGGFMMLGTDFRNLKDARYQGWFAGAGIAYGYSWVLNRHWNIEAEVGFGWAYSRYDKYPCASCGNKLRDNAVHNYVGPTKLALNLVYVF